MVRTMRQAAHIETKVDGNVWEQLDDLEKKYLLIWEVNQV